MSKNFEQNFSLKDWVTSRAANTPESVEEEAILQVQNGTDGGRRVEKIKMTDAVFEPAQETEDRQHKMTARISNSLISGAAAPTMPASPAQQIQIVRLLRDLGDRLRQSEKEREILWRELDSCRKLLTDIEDKTSKTEKAYLSIENKLNAPQTPVITQDSEEAKEFRKNIEGKITALETTTGSAVLRLEDAISENGKLSRRLEEVTQDRTLLLNKIEEIQETLADTQDTLRAKALVLLTDHALAGRTALPQTPAWSGNDTLRTQQPAPSAAKQAEDTGLESEAWWKNPSPKKFSMSRGALAAIVVLAVAAGLVSAKMLTPDFAFPSAKPEAAAPVAVAPVAPAKTESAGDENDMDDLAKLANQIEPGAQASAPSQAAEAALAQSISEDAMTEDAQSLAAAAETKAKDAFETEKATSSLSARIKADASLPPAVKAIETKAFAGDAEAQHDLAAVYTAGHAGVKTNYLKASQWFTEAAHNNIANAQYNLGVLYHQGLGLKQDTKHAIDLYRIAAANNHPEAEYNLGIAHIEGIGADYNPQIAAYYFGKAAAGGVVEAAYNMGLIEENGLLGEAQPDEAIFWYKLAANRGNTQAAEALSQLARQTGMTSAQADQTFKRVSAGKAEYIKGLAAPARTSPKPAVAKPAAIKSPAKTVAPVKAAAPLVPAPKASVPVYDPVIVAQIQEQLIRLGLYSGSADGTADDRTQTAVKSYQSANKLKIDGRPTEDVLVHMLAADLQPSPAAGN